MKVRHTKPKEDPSLGSMKDEAWVYRTEVINDNDRPIKVIWFEYYFLSHDFWYGVNIKNKVLREDDFIKWYAEGDNVSDHWIQPGQVLACDPNWNGYFECEEYPRVKWSFLAVDEEGNTYFDEAEVPEEATIRFKPE